MIPRILATLVLAALSALAADDAPTIYMIGDSTMANKKRADLPERGWGQLFPEWIKPPARLDNRALNGRSTRSFIAEGRWRNVAAALKPGDWVIIQFGHNDQKAGNPKVYAAADTDYQTNLRKFASDTRAKGAFPVIATSIARRHWDAAGKFSDTLGEYPAAARKVAADAKAPLLELHDLTQQMESGAGAEGSRRFHFKGDDTHLCATGARAVSALAAAEIRRLQLPLARWLRDAPVELPQPAIAPQSLRSTEVILVWEKTTAGSDKAAYHVYCNGADLGATRKAYFHATGLKPGNTHRFALGTGGDPRPVADQLVIETPPQEPVISVAELGAVGDATGSTPGRFRRRSTGARPGERLESPGACS